MRIALLGLVVGLLLPVGSSAAPGEDGGGLTGSRHQSSLRSAQAHTSGEALALLLARPPGDVARPALRGKVVVIDPGHQLGNGRFPRQVNRLVPAGGFRKPCNTTGTATNGGYAEATFNWQVARLLRRELERDGAKVLMTRTSNRRDRWGPCVDVRGRAGNRARADLKISIHADGVTASHARGFHVIAPADRARWTRDIHRPSMRLAQDVRRALRQAGVPRANYIAGGDGLDVRGDLGTLNLSDVPTVMVELGNMRNRADARRMTTPRGRSAYARALAAGARRFLN